MAKHGGSGAWQLRRARGVDVVRGNGGQGDLRGRREDGRDRRGGGEMRGGGIGRNGGQGNFRRLGAMSAIEVTSRKSS